MHTKFLTEKERIEILILRGCGDKKRSYEQVAHQFHGTHPDRQSISKSTVCNTVFRVQDTDCQRLTKISHEQRQQFSGLYKCR